MATAPQSGPQSVKPRREMVEVKSPEIFQFNRQGQILEGVLLAINEVTVNGKDINEYLIQGENSVRVRVLESADLRNKIQPNHIGHWLMIRYESDDSSFKKEGQSPMRRYRVEVSKEKEPGF